MNTLIRVNGFIGDALFASSIADNLPDFDTVDFVIQVFQPYELLRLNPNIRNVFMMDTSYNNYDVNQYDKVYSVGLVDQSRPATIQYQEKCGVKTPSLGYTVYTNEIYDEVARKMFEPYRKDGIKIITHQANWRERSFLFTPEEYRLGVDVPTFGYGGKHRDIEKILKVIHTSGERVLLVPVGFDNGVGQHDTGMLTTSIYSMTASIIKESDIMIGAEGGLTNLAAGVGTKTVITTDFIWQLYGPNGVLKKIENPKMGPYTYFPRDGHVGLDPFLTDEEVGSEIVRIINE